MADLYTLLKLPAATFKPDVDIQALVESHRILQISDVILTFNDNGCKICSSPILLRSRSHVNRHIRAFCLAVGDTDQGEKWAKGPSL